MIPLHADEPEANEPLIGHRNGPGGLGTVEGAERPRAVEPAGLRMPFEQFPALLGEPVIEVRWQGHFIPPTLRARESIVTSG